MSIEDKRKDQNGRTVIQSDLRSTRDIYGVKVILCMNGKVISVTVLLGVSLRHDNMIGLDYVKKKRSV